MPLTARLRDEENERINNILKKLVALDYVPELGGEIDSVLRGIGLDRQTLLDISAADLISHLENYNFDWANAEIFADFVASIAARLPESRFALNEKSVAIYNYIQSESKTFSLTISGKITSLKNS